MTLLALALALARSGGRLRALSVAAGDALGTLLVILVLGVPEAAGGSGSGEESILSRVVVLFLILPVGVLLLSVGRLAAGVRDRRLAALRLLGVSPGRTRLVAATENALLAIGGATLGAAASPLVAGLLSPAVRSAGWLAHDLPISAGRSLAVAAGVVALSGLVALAPTRRLAETALGMRRGIPARPSLWRLLPLLVGVGLCVGVIAYLPPSDADRFTPREVANVMIAGIALTGLGIPIALPVAVRLVADFLATRAPWTPVHLAGRRMQAVPTASARVVAGLATSVFVIIGALGVLAAFQSVGQYARPAHAIEHGPQLHVLSVAPDGSGRGPTAAQADGLRPAVGTLERVPGVQHVQPYFGIGVVATETASAWAGPVFVGTCDQLARFAVVDGCRDGVPALIVVPGQVSGPPPPRVDLAHLDEVTPGTMRVPADAVHLDPEATARIFPDSSPPGMVLPPDYPGLAAFAGPPTSFEILTEGGYAVRDRLATAAAAAGVTLADPFAEPSPAGVILRLQDMEDYDKVNGYARVLWTLAAVVLGLGAVSVLLTAIDYALARRRETAGQLALGMPWRTMGLSQVVEVLVPLVIAEAGAIALGYLCLRTYVAYGEADSAPANAGVLIMLLGSLAAAVVVAVLSMLGVGRRLTPDLLRRE